MRAIFPQNVIAVIWDFDKTLSPAYMQGPLFRRFGVNETLFWAEVNALPAVLGKAGDGSHPDGALRVNADTIYLNRILDYVRAGIFPGLSNELLRELGAELEFFPGLPDALPRLKQYVASNHEYSKFDLRLEHYIVSTGLREMIVGSAINEHVDGVWGCEFAVASPEPTAHKPETGQMTLDGLPGSNVISQVAYAIDNTSKTRAIFEINKGSNLHPDKIDVNSFMRLEDRRVPVENMIYIADGPSDTPVFSVIVGGGGKAFAVYPTADTRAFRQANDLQVHGRVHAVGEADYSPGAHASLWLEAEVDRIANRIVAGRQRELEEQVGRPAGHLANEAKPAKAAKAPEARSENDQLRDDRAASLAIDEVRQRFIMTTDPKPSEGPKVAEPESASGRRSAKRNVTK